MNEPIAPREAGEEQPVLLVAASWRERAFLLAELEERGYTVRALPGIIQAIGALVRHPHVRPSLVILDLAADPGITERALADLLDLTAPAPWIVIQPTTRRAPGQHLLHSPRVHLFPRPVRVGDIVDQAAILLGQKGAQTP